MRRTSITFLTVFLLLGCIFADDKKKEVALPTNVDFLTQVKPLIEGTCLDCHGEHEQEGEYRMDTKAATFKGGEDYGDEVIRPGNSNDSPVYWMTTEPKDGDRMPPKHPLTIAQQNILRVWIDKGAKWPDDVVLVEKPRINFKNAVLPILKKGGPFNAKQKEVFQLWLDQGAAWPEGYKLGTAPKGGPVDDLKLITKIRETIIGNSPEKTEKEMKAYENTIPKSGVKYEMLPIKGGEFMMGSPKDEKDRQDDEGPQHKVKVDPFWMGKFEVTWNMYEPFMITGSARNKDGSRAEEVPEDTPAFEIVTSPTTPYQEMSFGMGSDGFPAISMTQHAAQKFCEWLSAQTGHYYRLPTEAEWEYACRAGTTGPYSCPTDKLAEYAVMDPEQVRVGYEKVGTKKPNPWGLYDMHGNVTEWVLDQYFPDSYKKRAGDELTVNPLISPTELYPRLVRGGSWYDPPEELRSARRYFSEAAWKTTDPQLPQSIWYHTDAQWLGFRIVRPLTVPDAKELHRIWNMGAGEE